MERLKRLALSVTEGVCPYDREGIFRRFAEYKELGIQCVRIDSGFYSPSSGVWQM